MSTASGLYSDRLSSIFGTNVVSAGTNSPHSYWERTAEAAEEIENDAIDFHKDLLKAIIEQTKILKRMDKRDADAAAAAGAGGLQDMLGDLFDNVGGKGKGGRGARGGRAGARSGPRMGARTRAPNIRTGSLQERPAQFRSNTTRVGRAGVGRPLPATALPSTIQNSAVRDVARNTATSLRNWSSSLSTSINSSLASSLNPVKNMGRTLSRNVTNYTGLLNTSLLGGVKSMMGGLGRSSGSVLKAVGGLLGPLSGGLQAFDFARNFSDTKPGNTGMSQRVRTGGLAAFDTRFFGVPSMVTGAAGLGDLTDMSGRVDSGLGAVMGPAAKKSYDFFDNGIFQALQMGPQLLQQLMRGGVKAPVAAAVPMLERGGRVRREPDAARFGGPLDDTIGGSSGDVKLGGGAGDDMFQRTINVGPSQVLDAAGQTAKIQEITSNLAKVIDQYNSGTAAALSPNSIEGIGPDNIGGDALRHVMKALAHSVDAYRESNDKLGETITNAPETWKKSGSFADFLGDVLIGKDVDTGAMISGPQTGGSAAPSAGSTIMNPRTSGSSGRGGSSAGGTANPATGARRSLMPTPGALSGAALVTNTAALSEPGTSFGGDSFSGSAGPLPAALKTRNANRQGSFAGQSAAAEYMNYLIKYGASPKEAALIAGNAMVESGFDTKASGDKGSAFGTQQWRHDRRANLEAFAKEKGMPASSRELQAAFTMEEVNPKSKYKDDIAVRGWKKLQANPDMSHEDGAELFARTFERPNLQYAHMDKRRQHAREFANLETGGEGKIAVTPENLTGANRLMNPGAMGVTAPAMPGLGVDANGVVVQRQGELAATRKLAIEEDLQANVARTVLQVLGPGYRAEVYSGGQHAEGEGPHVGTVRHDHGKAADLKVYTPEGKQVTQEEYARVSQAYLANKRGGVGMQMSGGGIHMDKHTDKAPFWQYGPKEGGIPLTKESMALIQQGLKGVEPEYKMTAAEADAYLQKNAPRKVQTIKIDGKMSQTVQDAKDIKASIDRDLANFDLMDNPERSFNRLRGQTGAAVSPSKGGRVTAGKGRRLAAGRFGNAGPDPARFGDPVTPPTFDTGRFGETPNVNTPDTSGMLKRLGARAMEEQGRAIGKGIIAAGKAERVKVPVPTPSPLNTSAMDLDDGGGKGGRVTNPAPSSNGVKSNTPTPTPRPPVNSIPHTDELSMLMVNSSMTA